MKAIKKILATLLCLCFIFGCLSATVYADTPTGSITIQNQSGTNATVGGKTLNLFNIFSATKSGENISYQWVKESDGVTNRYESFFFGATGVTGNASGTIHDVVTYIESIKNDSFEFSQMAAKLHQYIHAQSITADKTSGKIANTATSYTFSDLDLGYYLIYDATQFSSSDTTPAVRSAAMLAHPGENKVINLKADRPHIEKYVDDSNNGTPDWQLGTTANVGDIVKFRIVTAVPDHDLYGNNYTFVISDKMDDTLALKESTIHVRAYNPADNSDVAIANSVSTTGLAAGLDFEVKFTNIPAIAKDTIIEVTYEAEVLASAALKNTNKATLTYSNDPNLSSSQGSADAEASVMLWQFVLTKHMEDASGTPSFIRLGGAQFQIFSKDDLTTPLKFTISDYTNPETSLTYTKYTFDPTAGTVTTLDTVNSGDDGKTNIGYTMGGSLGQIYIFGLGEGTYVIRETKAPDGYQIAKGDFEFTITDTIGITGGIANAVITEATRTEAPGKFTRITVDETVQAYYVGITNAPGSALPETGGMGTTLFTILGIVLMAGAVAFFTSRKRSSVA